MADGRTDAWNVIWFYLQAFLSLYLYFAVIGMIDTASTAEELKITLADFLENRMSERLAAGKAGITTIWMSRSGRCVEGSRAWGKPLLSAECRSPGQLSPS